MKPAASGLFLAADLVFLDIRNSLVGRRNEGARSYTKVSGSVIATMSTNVQHGRTYRLFGLPSDGERPGC
jgi:hypothetical protein